MGPGQVREGPPLRRRRGRCWLLRLALVAAAGVALYAAAPWYLPAAARALDVSVPPSRVDYVMVLGGGHETRPFVAAALVKAGLAGGVLLPNVKLSPEAEDGLAPPEHEITIEILARRGVNPDLVTVLPGEVNSTSDEAQALAAFLVDKPNCSVAVVTNHFHTRRASWVFRKALGPRSAQVRFFGAPVDGFDETNWWRHEAGVHCYLMEYVKLPYYWLRY
ncbi:MAG TPA: YdcF family protein [Gemmataceae bacterium]|nr:YdcF family protein [Gemmataceae bacterium]